jgi:hypothetical protein
VGQNGEDKTIWIGLFCLHTRMRGFQGSGAAKNLKITEGFH